MLLRAATAGSEDAPQKSGRCGSFCSAANVGKGSEADIRRESEFLFRCYSDPLSER
jgi:hypothetical protein